MPPSPPSPAASDRESKAPGALGWSRALPRIVVPLVLALGCLLLGPMSPAGAAWLHLEGPVPTNLGVGSQGLTPCPSPAHCAWASWPVEDAPAALAALLPSVLALEGVELVETEESYLHATVTSRLLGFVDDLELFADGPHRQLQARSQSRLGDSDLGVNRRRLERLHQGLLNSSSQGATAAGLPAGT